MKALVRRAAALAALFTATFAYAQESSRCVDIAIPKKAVNDGNGKWVELTQNQWEFVRGIYAMNPLTPPGLPYGDKAVLAEVGGNQSGLIFFIDGDRACTPMPAPSALVDMILKVGSDTIDHEGSGL